MEDSWRRQYGYTIPLDGEIPPYSVIQEYFGRRAATDGCSIDYITKKASPYSITFVGVCTTV